MNIELNSDFPVTDEACKAATGKTFGEWFAAIEAHGSEKGRRDVVQWIYNETGRGKDVWWPTTIWVSYEASKGTVKKDGLAEGYNICSTKTISAGVDSIYAAFTEAGKNAWLGCSAAAEGVAYTDGGGNTGTWLRLRPGKDVRIAWQTKGVPNATAVDATFTDSGKGKTLVNVMHNRIQTREETDGLRNAWGEALNRLKAELEG